MPLAYCESNDIFLVLVSHTCSTALGFPVTVRKYREPKMHAGYLARNRLVLGRH